jgi:tetratricopeptide (TPR) repeat protein
VEELELSRLVSVERGTVCIAHQLFRGAIYHGMSNARRALLHRTIAEHLTTTEQAQPGELAVHFAQAGEEAAAARYGRTAADKALENGAVAEAAYFLQLVIENETRSLLKAEATGDLARVLHMNREILRANPLLELAATRLRAAGNTARALRMEVRRVEGLAEVGAAPMSELLDRLAAIKTAARSGGDDEALAFALDYELHLLHRSGKVAEIRRLFGEIRDCLASPNPTARCQANASLALQVLFGDGDEGLECAREAVRVAEAEGLKEYALLSLNRLILALVTRGMMNVDDHRQIFSRAEALAAKSGDRELRFHLHSNMGVFFLDSGDTDQAEASFATAGALVSTAEATFPRFTNSYNLGELAVARRDYETGLFHFTAAERLLNDRMPGFCSALIAAASGLCSLEMGAMSEARQREPTVSGLAGDWYFDPTIVFTFSTRLLERRQRTGEAIALLEAHLPALRNRFPCAWIRLTLRQAAMRRRQGTGAGSMSSLTEARALAERLQLPFLQEQVSRALVAAR